MLYMVAEILGGNQLLYEHICINPAANNAQSKRFSVVPTINSSPP